MRPNNFHPQFFEGDPDYYEAHEDDCRPTFISGETAGNLRGIGPGLVDRHAHRVPEEAQLAAILWDNTTVWRVGDSFIDIQDTPEGIEERDRRFLAMQSEISEAVKQAIHELIP